MLDFDCQQFVIKSYTHGGHITQSDTNLFQIGALEKSSNPANQPFNWCRIWCTRWYVLAEVSPPQMSWMNCTIWVSRKNCATPAFVVAFLCKDVNWWEPWQFCIILGSNSRSPEMKTFELWCVVWETIKPANVSKAKVKQPRIQRTVRKTCVIN